MLNNPDSYITGYFVFLIFTTIFSALINQVFIRFSRTLGIRNHDETIVRWSTTSKPAFGGISFYIIFLLSGAIYSLVFANSGETIYFDTKFIGLLAATGVAFLMGLADDAYNTNPMLKFGSQIICGTILIATGTYISIFDSQVLNYCLTLFWVLGMMNSINMLDNMDGITTIVSIFIILSAILTIYLHNDYSDVHVIILVGVLGALIGFLFHNWNPSKMFMGDTGSQFLGVFLAAVGITYFWNNTELGGGEVPTKQITITLLAFIMPIIDTTTVTINRLRRGQAPYIGGKDHTTHHLSYLGFSDKKVAILFGLFSFISFVLISIIINIEEWNHGYTAIFLSYFVFLFGVLYYITINKKAKNQFLRGEIDRRQKENAKK